MQTVLTTLALVAVAVGSLAAQDPPRRQELQQRVVQRFMANYRTQAGLTDEQTARFEEMTRRSFEANGELQRRERAVWRGLEGQMRPGVAADADSVVGLLDELQAIHAARAEQFRADQERYAEFLSPVQRAQLAMAWRRLQQQVQQIRREMMDRPGPGGRLP